MRKNFLLIVSLCAMLWAPKHFAQKPQSVYLSIGDMFDLIDRNNSDVKVARQAVEVSKQSEAIANAARLPEVLASLSLNYLGDATLMDRDFSNAMCAEMPHFGNTLNLTAYQPVYAGGAITGGIDLAKSKTSFAELGLENTQSEMRLKVIECYLNLFKYQNLEAVYRENIALTEQLIEDMKIKEQNGIVLKNDITRYELRLANLKYDMTTIENNINIMNHDLTSYLGLDSSVTIVPDSALLKQLMPIDGLDYWMTMAKSNSLALRQVGVEREVLLNSDKIARSQLLPHVGIVAGNTFNGPITIEVPPINKNINYWWVGINISYNFSSLFKVNKEIKRNALDLFRLEEKKVATLEAVNREIEQSYILYTQAHDLLGTQQKNVELATENYRVVNHRFENQLALLTDMLDASTSKLDAEVRLVNAHISTIYFYYQLKFISGTL